MIRNAPITSGCQTAMQGKNQSRSLPEVDAQNVMYCLFVVSIHLFPSELLSHWYMFLFQRILYVSIFGFIFLSGCKQFLHIHEKTPLRYYMSRCKKILIPYFIAAVVYLLVYLRLGYIQPNLGRMLFLILTGEVEAHFYFIIALVQLYLLTPLLNHLLQRYSKTHVLVLSFFIMLLTVLLLSHHSIYNRIFTRYLFCYTLGCCAGACYEHFVEKLRIWSKPIGIIFLAAFIFELSAAYLARYHGFSPLIQQIISMIYMPIAVIFIYSRAAKAFGKSPLQNRLIRMINRNSYFVYLYHILAILTADAILKTRPISNIYIIFFIRIILTAVIIGFVITVKEILLKTGKSRRSH